MSITCAIPILVSNGRACKTKHNRQRRKYHDVKNRTNDNKRLTGGEGKHATREKDRHTKTRDPKNTRDDELRKRSQTKARKDGEEWKKGVNHLFVTCYKPRNHLTSVVITGKGKKESVPASRQPTRQPISHQPICSRVKPERLPISAPSRCASAGPPSGETNRQM